MPLGRVVIWSSSAGSYVTIVTVVGGMESVDGAHLLFSNNSCQTSSTCAYCRFGGLSKTPRQWSY
jgi:hypothetical protein